MMLLLLLFLTFALAYLLYRYLKIRLHFEEILHLELNKWKEKELEEIKAQLYNLIDKEYRVKFEGWLNEKEREIRKDAVKRSSEIILGKVGEQFAPLLVFEKYNLNPKDARFLGSPIDYIIFSGMSEGKLKEIVFVEIKHGTSKLSKTQAQIKEAIENKKVDFLEIEI